MISRRSLFRGIGATGLIALAPAIVRAGSLMPISSRFLNDQTYSFFNEQGTITDGAWKEFQKTIWRQAVTTDRLMIIGDQAQRILWSVMNDSSDWNTPS